MSTSPNNPFFRTVPGNPEAVVNVDLAAYTKRIGMSREAVFAWIRHLELQGYVETRTAPREAGAAGVLGRTDGKPSPGRGQDRPRAGGPLLHLGWGNTVSPEFVSALLAAFALEVGAAPTLV